MAVKSTSRTAMAPMTTFARRDRVGTDTGGRMATRVSFSCGRDGAPRTVPATDGRVGPGSGPPGTDPVAQTNARGRAGFPGRPLPRQLPPPRGVRVAGAASAGPRGPAGADVLERGQGLVQVRHPGEDEARPGGTEGVAAVVGRDEEELGADLLRGDHLQLDPADRADGALGVDRAAAGHHRALGEVGVADEVEDAEREHEPRRGAA